MKAKKMLALLAAGAMALSVGAMAACDNKNDDDNGGGGGGGNYTVDTTEYYLAGGGSGTLSQNGWNETNHVLKLVRDEDADHNLFNITIDMYAGDAFQIVHDDSWDGQMGIEYLQGVDEENCVKDEEGNVVFKGAGTFGKDVELQTGHDGTYTFSLHTFPGGEKDPYITYTKDAELSALLDMYVVSDMNWFGMLDVPYEQSHMTKNGNIWQYVLTIEESDLKRDAEGEVVEEGAQYVAVAVQNDVENEDGTHTITCDYSDSRLSVFIDGDEYNLLGAGVYTLRFNADEGTLTIIDGAFELYFIGSFNGWDQSAPEEYKLTAGGDGNWTGYLTITEADYADEKEYAEVKLFNPLANGWYSANGDSNMELTAGTYFFKFTTATLTVEYEEVSYYIVGTLVIDGANVNFSVAEKSPKFELTEDGVYTVDVEVTDVTSIGDYSWISGGIFACKFVYYTELGGIDWGMSNTVNGQVEDTEFMFKNDNLIFKTEGTYTFTYDPATKTLSVALAEAE